MSSIKTDAVSYPRVSDQRQVKNTSLDTQEAACRKFAATLGANMLAVFREEGQSAKTADRTMLKEALKYCVLHAKRIKYFIVYHKDRFSRNSGDFHALKRQLTKLGIELRSVLGDTEDSPEGRLSESVQVALAQYDNEVKAIRTTLGMEKKIRLGRWVHAAPLGHLQGVKGGPGPSLLLDPERADLIHLGFVMASKGDRTISQILEELTARGLRTRTGKRLLVQTLTKILHNPIYKGLIVSGFGITAKGDFESIVSEELFDRVQDVLTRRGNKPSKRTQDDPRLPLRRFMFCAWCETPITGSFTSKKLADGSRTGHGYYRCRNKACNPGDEGRWNIRKDDLERAFLDEVNSLAVPRGLASIFADILREVWKDRNSSKEQARKKLEQRLDGFAEERTRLTRVYAKGRIPDEVYSEQIERCLADAAEARSDLDRLCSAEPDAESLLPVAESVLSNPSKLWQEADAATRLVFQRFLFPEGLPFDGESIGTAVTSPLFSHLRAWQRGKKRMVTPRGFEPRSPG